MTTPLPESVTQSRSYQILESSLEQGRLSHAILLHGENLKTLEQVTEHIAGKLLKTDKPFQHPDCFFCRPRGKARMITIGKEDEKRDGKWPEGTMRRLVTDLSMSSNQGGNKIGIIYEADRLNMQASNAFLKTLEEPPAGTTLFLLTSRPYSQIDEHNPCGLLETIRSRCFNFRVPAELGAVSHPNWEDWLSGYRKWLTMLIEGPDKKSVPHIIMALYGLNSRFQKISNDLSAEEWESVKPTLPEHFGEKDIDAAKIGVFKTFRTQLLGEVEKMTANYARDLEKANPGRLPAAALNRATESLEKSAGLLELNFNQAAALERFFLTSLRIWTAAR